MEKVAGEVGAGADAGGMLCPGCGYDLRGTGGGRCSECGLEMDRGALAESGVPWAHRGKIGRVRAYLRTVWGIVADGRGLRQEAGRPQEAGDGRAFRRVNAAIVAVALLTAWGWGVGAAGGVEFLAYRPAPVWGPGGGAPAGWVQDLLVPWSAGATMPWVVPMGLVLLAWYGTGVQQAVFRVSTKGEAYWSRAGVIAHYAAAPLVLLLPAVGCAAGLAAVFATARGNALVATPIAVATILFAGGATVGTLVRVGQWAARVRHGGAGTAVGAAAELAGLWLLGVVLFLVVLPWKIGYVLIFLDSYR